MAATVELGIKKHDQAKVDKYISQQIKSYTKRRERGHRDFKSLSDSQIRDMAECMARIYNVGEIYEWVQVQASNALAVQNA